MIPFWKKTDKGGKKTPPKPAIPHTAQQSIPMQRMFEDGTCRVRANYYTRTIAYQDINYQLAQQEDKNAIFEESSRNTWTHSECEAKYSVPRSITYWRNTARNYFCSIVVI